MKITISLLFTILFLCLQASVVSAIDPIVENADAVWNSNLDTSPTNLTNTTSSALPRPLIAYPNTAFNFRLKECPEELTDNASKALARPLIEYPNTAFSFPLEESPKNLVDVIRKILPRPLVEYPNTVLTKSLIFPKELINDTTPPIITNITVTNITNNSAMIKWDTDEVDDSSVKYSKVSGIYTQREEATLFVKNHSIELTGLFPGICYYFVVNSTDQSGNSNESIEYKFITTRELKVFDTGAPENLYPSIFGKHNGTIKPNQKLQCPCFRLIRALEHAGIQNLLGYMKTAL